MAMRPRAVGFCSAAKNTVSVVGDDDALLRFDSGEALTFAEGQRNVLILGQNGSGKTTSAVLPMLDACIGAGYSGVILDVKGNLTAYVRKLARRHGRGRDIIEIGNRPGARKINLLKCMPMAGVYGILKLLAITKEMHSSSNYSWYLRGINDVRNLAGLMRLIAKTERLPFFEPSLRLIKSLVSDWNLATGLRTIAENILSDPREKNSESWVWEAKECLDNIRSGNFGFLNAGMKSANYGDQTSWRLEAISEGLADLAQSPGCMDNFSADESDNGWLDFDLKKLVYSDGKIIAVHFTPGAGPAADKISSAIKDMWYRTVIENGLFLPEGKRTFTFADEFQATANFNDDIGMSDQRFFAMSREFKNINVIATQNIDNLKSDLNAWRGAEALLSNCATHIYFQTSAPRTLKWIGDSCSGSSEVRGLGRGECAINHVGEDGHADFFKDGLNVAYSGIASLGNVKTKPFRRKAAKRNLLDDYLKTFLQALGGSQNAIKKIAEKLREFNPAIVVSCEKSDIEVLQREMLTVVWPLLAMNLRRHSEMATESSGALEAAVAMAYARFQNAKNALKNNSTEQTDKNNSTGQTNIDFNNIDWKERMDILLVKPENILNMPTWFLDDVDEEVFAEKMRAAGVESTKSVINAIHKWVTNDFMMSGWTENRIKKILAIDQIAEKIIFGDVKEKTPKDQKDTETKKILVRTISWEKRKTIHPAKKILRKIKKRLPNAP